MEKTLIIGTDVSKGYADFVALNASREPVGEPFQLPDNKEGHKALRERLKHWRNQCKYKRIVLAAESTGGYEDNWLRCVRQEPLCESYRINPKVTHHEYRIQQRSSVTDRVSALTIAQHVAKNLDSFRPRSDGQSDELIAAQSLARQIVLLEKNATTQKNSLEKLLYRCMPAFLAIKSSEWAAYYLRILANYGSRKSIQRAAKQGFKKISRVPAGFAAKAYEALKDGVGMEDTHDMMVLSIQSKAEEILHLEAAQSKLTKQLINLAPVDKKLVELLCSIKGMGPRTATILLIYIGSIKRFESASQIAAFFGVVPRLRFSGDGASKVHMSKQGNALVRRELYLLAFRTISNEPYFRALYNQQRQKGKCHDSALGVLMHKLIRVIYGMLHTNTKFDPGVDQLNQTKQDNNAKVVAKVNSSRAIDLASSAGAPISSYKRKKLKEDYDSQAATLAESTGSS